jgi:hypothetical protein
LLGVPVIRGVVGVEPLVAVEPAAESEVPGFLGFAGKDESLGAGAVLERILRRFGNNSLDQPGGFAQRSADRSGIE